MARRSVIIRKKFVVLLTMLITAWFVISVYFYCQHYRVVKRYNIDKNICYPGITVAVKEIVLEAFSPDANIEKLQDSCSGPWYYKIASKLPRPLQVPFVEVCYFYSTPYEFNHLGTLSLKGMLLVDPSNISDWDLMDKLDIYLYDEDMHYYGRGFGITRSSLSNYYLFSVKSKNAPFHKKAYKIIIKDKRHDDLRSFVINPSWQLNTYTFFNRRIEQYPFDPFKIINETFLSLMRQDKKEEARKFLMRDSTERLLWNMLDHGYWTMGGTEYVAFEGSRGGFEGVYSANIVFGNYESGFAPENLIPVASQKLYFIIKDGSPLVIDANPVEVKS